MTRENELWVFGYGSLVWRPSIPYVKVRWARLTGFVRRFYQGSTDHRGVPGLPGRVVTLLPSPPDDVMGKVYQIPSGRRDEVLARLDHREKGGYARFESEVELYDDAEGVAQGTGEMVRALVYVATPDNENYLGPATEVEIARQVAVSFGPSGPNDEYVLRLADALRERGHPDPHVESIARELKRMSPSGEVDDWSSSPP